MNICFTCGRIYTKGDGRFCSPNCRDAFDCGVGPYNPDASPETDAIATPLGDWIIVAGPHGAAGSRLYPQPHVKMTIGKRGFHMQCPGCGNEFESTGLKFCTTQCGMDFRSRDGSEPTCEHCSAVLPRSTRRKRFCDDRCKMAAFRNKTTPSGRGVAPPPVSVTKRV